MEAFWSISEVRKHVVKRAVSLQENSGKEKLR